MTTRTEKIARLGTLIENADLVAEAASRADLGLAIAGALVKKETGGRNIYGHDRGGVFSTIDGPVTIFGETFPKGSDIPVTPQNFLLFSDLVVRQGKVSNGVGFGQTTYRGFFPLMFERGLLPWEPLDEMTFEFERVADMLDDGHTLPEIGTLYNAGNLKGGITSYGYDFERTVLSVRAVFRA